MFKRSLLLVPPQRNQVDRALDCLGRPTVHRLGGVDDALDYDRARRGVADAPALLGHAYLYLRLISSKGASWGAAA